MLYSTLDKYSIAHSASNHQTKYEVIFMATAKKLPSGNWRTKIFVGKDINGKNIYKSFTAKTKKESEYMATEYVVHKNTKNTSPLNMTLGEAMNSYCELKSAILSPSTLRGYKSLIKSHLLNLQNIRLDKLTKEMIQKEINKECVGRSAKTVKNIHGFLSAVLQQYYPEFRLNTALPQKEKPILYIPSTEEVNMILQFTKKHDTDLYIAILLASCLGMRRGEICALEWNDFNWKEKRVQVSKSLCLNDKKEYVLKAPKSYSGYREIPIPDTIYTNLIDYKKDNGNVINITPGALSTRFQRLLQKIELPHFTFHNLRHFNASIMLALNIPNKYAMEFMGHATDNMLKNVYQHTMDFKRQEAAETINKFFSQTVD